MADFPKRAIKLEVESPVVEYKPDLDSYDSSIHHDAAGSGSGCKIETIKSESTPDESLPPESKFQNHTSHYIAKIDQLESQLQQSRNELNALYQELPARLQQAKREERQKTFADLAVEFGLERRVYDTLTRSHLEQLQQARFEAYNKGYRDGKEDSLRFEARHEEQMVAEAEEQMSGRNEHASSGARDVEDIGRRSLHPPEFFPDQLDVLAEYYKSREIRGQRV